MSSSLLECVMSSEDRVIQCFKRLVDLHGIDEVAERIGASAEYLKQIVAGYKLKSGQPRGVGPSLRKKLTEQFSGWDAEISPGIKPDDQRLLQAIQGLSVPARAMLEAYMQKLRALDHGLASDDATGSESPPSRKQTGTDG